MNKKFVYSNVHGKDTVVQVGISFFLNGELTEVFILPGISLLEMLHEEFGLLGTKLSCNEGDCGSCTVVVASAIDEAVVYQAVNSCIYPAVRIHDKHLITIEGVSSEEELHPIQKVILDHHGSQCGYCTPGFVMSMLGLFLNNPYPSREEIMAALEGNLCRCTGYEGLIEAALFLRDNLDRETALLPRLYRQLEGEILNERKKIRKRTTVSIEPSISKDYYQPDSIDMLTQLLDDISRKESFSIVAGATDVMVRANVNHDNPNIIIDINEVKELNSIRYENNKMYIGATTTLDQLHQSDIIREKLPLLPTMIRWTASQQIRNMATLVGNIANSSPIADGATTLLALNAKIEMVSAGGTRQISLQDFYVDYKTTVMMKNEFISNVIIPLPRSYRNIYQDFCKSAKRKAVDISSVVSAISVVFDGKKIKTITLAFGGVKEYPALANKTMEQLYGQEIDQSRFTEIAESVQNEFTPISDVRGSKEYRSLLVRNHTLYYLQNIVQRLKPEETK